MSGNKNKTAKEPKAPAIAGPPNYNTPFATSTYDKASNTYNVDSPLYDASSAQSTTGLAADAFTSQLRRVQNPEALVSDQRKFYEDTMFPEYNYQTAQARGNMKGTLGNRLYSTFGQMTAQNAAEQEGLSRAALRGQIETLSQGAVDRELARAAGLGTLASSAQEYSLYPFQVLSMLQQPGNTAVSNTNNALASIYNTQSNMFNTVYNAQQQAAAQRYASRMGLAGQAIGGGAQVAAAYLKGA